ncbi:DsbA family protein [Saccharospirillum salsuginis]|uniref:Outer membrane protein n=1 Tax=Saccharospirillum salsuginis TaxID=418750 RepID=A0A918K4U4_9GAMM|nr:DsbA family protein [Saccharospirillum salsuginis]GGX49396.1 outer membrane protein [Saccharospirillum salsuginis]
MIQKSRWTMLVLIPLMALTALTVRAEEMSEQEVERIVRDYLLENPEVIVEAINVLRQREQAAEEAAASEQLSGLENELVNAERDPVGGNPDGQITLVEFFDYNCGYCKRVNSTLQALIEDNPDLRVVYKEFPILSETSMTAARASLAVNALYPEQYETFHRRLLDQRGSLQQDSQVWDAVAQLDVDVEAVKTEAGKSWVQDTISRNHQLAQQLNITGTPTFIVGDSILRGAYPQADIQDAIDKNS